MSYITGGIDPQLAIALGRFETIKSRSIFGIQFDADTGASVDVWGNASLYTPPTSAQTIDITAGANDSGVLRSSGLITTASINQIIDASADFVGDGVVAGDVVLNDTNQDHSLVTKVVSANVLDVIPMRNGIINEIGGAYRIVEIADTGAAVLHISEGLDADLNIQSEFVILDNINTVSTVNQYSRINYAQIIGAGSGGSNGGEIQLTASVDTTIAAQIPAGYGQTVSTHYTIPRGYDAYMTNIAASLFRSGAASDAMAQISIHERVCDGLASGSLGNDIRGVWGISVFGASGKPYIPYVKVSEFSDVWMRVEEVSDNNSIVSGAYDLILVEK
jgi:hypothetical protein